MRTNPNQSKQQGVTLLVVMVMLVVIGLVSVSAMRRAASADLVANNSRLEQLAKQSAEAGLRYCEAQIDTASTKLTIQSAQKPPALPMWQTLSNWSSSNIAVTVPTDFMKSADAAMVTPKQLPQCMAEYSPLDNNIVIITSRGFSPDYSAMKNGETQSGSVIWLQSIVSLQS
ncbi:MAG: hypothetical protein EKK47_11360 [Burkholderiales bacterium]|nr:MAG: hypothetical protein EKK47_11360 [Burkholderiales bacterium]